MDRNMETILLPKIFSFCALSRIWE